MKKKTKKYNSDFFTHAKEVVGGKRFKTAIKKADKRIKTFSMETLELLEKGLASAKAGRLVRMNIKFEKKKSQK